MNKKQTMKRALSLLLSLVMLVSYLPAIHVHAASNMDGGLEGQTADVFTALGFDTSVLPEGYDPNTADNPFGRDKLPGDQIFEVIVGSSDGMKTAGKDDNSVNVSGVVGTLGGTKVPLEIFNGAAGDFDGDGLAGEVIYVGIPTIDLDEPNCTEQKVKMYLYDGRNGSFGSSRDIATLRGLVEYEEEEFAYGGADGRLHKRVNSMLWDTRLYGYTEVSAGDYDGDGYAEIAVYVPESGNARVDIYKWMRDENSTADGWKSWNNWSVIWSRPISSTSYVPNMVSLLSSDINQDGIDDLGIAYSGITYKEWFFGIQAAKVELTSQAVILWGDRNNMLQTGTDLDLHENELGTQVRTSLNVGDLDGDGYKELVVTGQPSADFNPNKIRSIVVYTYDGQGGLVATYKGNQKVVDGSYETTDDGTTEEWISANGFDDVYLSSVVVRTNAAVMHLEGYDYGLLYLDSCIYEYIDGSMTLKMCLDDESYDGTNTLGTAWLGADIQYIEYGAVAADLNGSGYDQLYTGFAMSTGHGSYSTLHPLDDPNTAENELEAYDDPAKYTRLAYHFGGFSGLQGNSSGTLTAKTLSRNVEINESSESVVKPCAPEDIPHYSLAVADVDMDTTLLVYTGIHRLTYEDPKVLAVVAAAPYFKDVDVICDYDYAWQNTTSWSRTEGEGHGTTVQIDLESGAYISQGSKFNELEVATLFTMEWAQESTETTEYTLTFETSQDEDAVAFFSIPTEHYEYIRYEPNGQGGYDTDYYVVSRPFQAVYQVLTLDYYESIRGDYENLPAIRGEILKSTPGDPSSYPATDSGYDVIAKWNDDPAGVSFGNGAITQEITITKEQSESYNLGAAVDTQAGGGYDGTFASVMAGVTFSMNPSGGWMDYNLEGTTISGTVTNMPLEFQDYGYYYNWALFSYVGKAGGSEFPVVSYLVNDVSEPPRLPQDFQQDVDRTTSSKNVLTWSYDGEYSKFIIYKYFDFPVGGGLQVIAEYAAGEAPYTLKYDEEGKPYKEFYFEDTNLAPYSEHQYAIQVERLKMVPPLSSPSGLLTARTKAAVGNPIIGITESDGTNDGLATVYPDKNSFLIAQVTGPDGEQGSAYYSVIQYQWQKQNDEGKWEDLINETNQTLTIESAGSSTTGIYRCRINVITNTDNTAITAYSDGVALTHSKRSTRIEEAYALDLAGNVKIYAKVVNAHADSATVPDGYVTFNFVNTSTGDTYPVNVPLDHSGVASVISTNSLPQGQYRVSVIYSGSYVFKSSSTETYYMVGQETGYSLEALDAVTYGEGAEITFNELTVKNGITQAEAVDAESIVLIPIATGTHIISGDSGWITTDVGTLPTVPSGYTLIQTGEPVTKGGKYLVKFRTNTPESGGTVPKDWYVRFTPDVSGVVRQASWSFPNARIDIMADTGHLTRTGTGRYTVADNIPVGIGVYIISARSASGAVVSRFITIRPRPITLQLPDLVKKQDSSQVMGDITYSGLKVVSGSWADCDTDEEGAVTGEVAAESVAPRYTNTAGKVFDKYSTLSECGYYTISASDWLDNYAVTFRPGSLSVIGGSRPITFGVRPFEGQSVGTLYMVSPDYAYTREEKGMTMKEAVGSRVVFTAAPDDGYQVYDWYVDGVPQGVTENRFSYVMLNQDVTVEVQFVFKPNTLVFGAAGATEGGTLTCSDEVLTSGSIVIPNTYLTFTAQAKEGYHFKEWRYTELGKGTAYYAEDDGKMSSTFQLLMPKISCSVYAVFERDGYTLTYTDKAGNDGLTAWYWGIPSGDTTAELEKITVASGDSVPGDTEIVIQAREGYELNDDYNFVSTGTQGTADYTAGTYTLVLTEDTEVTGYTIRNQFDVTVDFDIETTYTFCEGAQVTLTIDGTEYVYDCPEDDTTYSVAGIAGGSKVSVSVSYPGYYVFDGWDVSGTLEKAETFTVPELGKDTTFTLKLTEKPTYTVTLADIEGKGTYEVTLPEGAGMEGAVITCHENDPLTIQVIPGTGNTVTYWNVSAAEDEGWESKASSLKYQFPKLTADYTFTPVFAATTYHIISWPMLPYYDVTLTPLEGYLTTVPDGADFKFTLSGGEDQYEYVMVNGQKFYDDDIMGDHYPFRYAQENGVRVYTIYNITANQEITVSMQEPEYGVNITPAAAEVGAGKTVTLTAEGYGVNLNNYKWSIVWTDSSGFRIERLQEGPSNTLVYQVPLTPGQTVTIMLQAGNADNGVRDVVARDAVITITDAVDTIAVTTGDLTADQDGSFLIHPITPTGEIGKYDFDALVTMYSGQTNEDVTWSLWGAQMRGTSIDQNGVLTVSDKEYGTGGQLKVIATYTYANGDTDKQEVIINLSTEAYVAGEVVNDIHGTVAEIGYVAGGETVTVTATPDENHAVAVWTINGVAVADNTSNSLTFTVEEMTHYAVTVEFTHYYPNMEHDETNHWMECSCGHKTEVQEHYDFDKNHFCDKCDYQMTQCADEDKDHFCDWCGVKLTECADEVKDHICDWCGETLTICIDEDTDHVCDWCGVTISECEDVNGNHFCDYCKKKLTDCVDNSLDHNCDICGRELSKCADEDGNHLCDICSKPLSECADEDKDHNCDLCGVPLSECVDDDKDHNCDYCGKEDITDCLDEDQDHLCDICGEKLTECADADSDHACDLCGEILSQCADEDDHLCDVCGETLSECADADSDHLCDICGQTLTECADEDKDHLCDVCGQTLTDCADENSDHACDICGKVLTACVDEDQDNICDICGKELNAHDCADENSDHKCDICGKALTECADEDKDHNCDLCGASMNDCIDENKDHNCDYCGKEDITACTDEDKDHNCDICGEPVSECGDVNKDHMCDICGKTLTECADDDKDHNCDVCGVAVSVCADGDNDHICDICGGTLTVCVDEPDAETGLRDHLCDICGSEISQCVDENKDHKCDLCGAVLGECADEDADHLCDICGAVLSECVDEADEETGLSDHICDICGEIASECEDKADEETGLQDHKCDACGKVLTQCEDELEPLDQICDLCGADMHECADEEVNEEGYTDHLCDICGYELTQCVDEETDEEGNTDHICDICGDPKGVCADEETDEAGFRDHKCDACGEILTECADEDDHKCDICGKVLSECVDVDHNDVCDICGGETYLHADENSDHRCDVCALPLSECDDQDKDHLCDLCGIVWSVCVDKDKNHACDICSAPMGTHANSENSHICEYCGEAASECADGDMDHLCDICGKELSTCADEETVDEAGHTDHKCDLCGKTLTECTDEETDEEGHVDHLCDICGVEVSQCLDEETVDEAGHTDHKCDLCGAVLTECVNEVVDHNCDICGESLGECVDENKDHMCDIAGEKLTDCEDLDNDHLCDLCGAVLSECADADDDHMCDLCGESVTETIDKDRDHICDICGEKVSECSDSNKDHICDICGTFLGECTDEDKDHKCDTCGKTISECADEDGDHNCDICGKTISECADEDADHKCDLCGETASVCADEDSDHNCDVCGETVSECADEDKDHKCDICGKTISECADEDGDHNCDICGKTISECADEDGDHNCDSCGSELGFVARIYGANRFKTSFKVADELKLTLGVEMFESVIIASGTSFADALSGSYLASVKNAPVLLTLGDTMNAELHAYIEENLVKGGTVYILGGDAAVPKTLDVMMEGYNVVRLAGGNRFETNLMILKEAGVEDGSEILVCTGTNFADSLSASAAAKPILLVFNESGKLYGAQPEYLAGLQNCTFTVIGGENAVSADLAKAFEAYGKVERLAGANRFETSVMVAQKYFDEPTDAVLAYAWNYPDGLCGGSLAYAMDAPLILTMTDYEEQAVEYAKAAGIEVGLVLGGDSLISDEAVRAIFAMEEADEIVVK